MIVIEHINALVNYCKSIPSKVNLIEYNSIGDQTFRICQFKT